MSVEAMRTQASLHALEYLVSQLIKALPKDRQDAMYAAAQANFTGHQPEYDSEALVVVRAAFLKAGMSG